VSGAASAVIRLYEGLDWNSPTLIGPYESVGDCLMETECRAVSWYDTALPARDGDTVGWTEPDVGETAKWFYVIGGVELIACKYFAQCGTPKFGGAPFFRMVAEIRYPSSWPVVDPTASTHFVGKMQELQRGPRRRPHLVAFSPDLFSPRYAA
jgi:hypothetical protein